MVDRICVKNLKRLKSLHRKKIQKLRTGKLPLSKIMELSPTGGKGGDKIPTFIMREAFALPQSMWERRNRCEKDSEEEDCKEKQSTENADVVSHVTNTPEEG